VTSSPLLATLALRDYRRYASGNAFSLIGTWMQRVGVGWLMWQLTGSGTWLGIVAFADLAPAIVLGPLGGAIADRVSPLRITFIAQALCMIIAAALAVTTAMGHITPGLLAFLVALQGMAMGFHQPARMALIYRIVDREHLPSAVAFNSVLFNTARFIGPAAAGAVLVLSGPALVFAINSASFLFFLAALATLKVEAPTSSAGADPANTSIIEEVLDGARYAARHPVIGSILLFSAILSFALRPYVELLPGFVDRVLGGGAAELAALNAAAGLGAVVAGLWLAARGGALATRGFALVVSAVAALAILGMALSTQPAYAMAFVVIAGAAMVMAGITVQTLIQLAVDGPYRGRVMSLYGLMFRSGPAFGALIMGVASEWVGLQWPIAVGACLALIVGFALRRTFLR
jgi:MFS family permease